MIKSLQADRMLAQKNVRHGFYMRHGGVSTGGFSTLNCALTTEDELDAVLENRKRVADDFGVSPDHLISCRQIHSADVMVVKEPWPVNESPEVDAMVTKERGIALGIVTADCVPVIFADGKSGVIGACHAGWRGALAGVVEQTVEAMEKLGAVKENIVASIGPCIWQDSYEVDLQNMVHFTEKDVNNRRFFVESENPSHYMFDLPGFVRAHAIAAGVMDCTLPTDDTFTNDEDFFSCRRSAKADESSFGRQISVIMLND